ncbi:flagellin [Pseudoalteromonas denitrificans]|uniref:Flagellin n=1 Tax=Pseudoalteromonas denitrificans DSM 6059 TaxID=1123010 RepID=A0A1I1KZM8_9GAMM|nr:flagellin [Pseudoalteromonas denitrificans]SFC64198.1 flagellin [Pseudoalteromonas denitrificans DSM 6059]
MKFSVGQPTSMMSFIDVQSKKREEQSEKLASGLKINSASDDAAGLQLSNRLTSQIEGLNRLVGNAQDKINANNVADAQLSSITDTLQRANELSIQSGNPLYSNSAVQAEFDQLTEEINLVAEQALGQSNFISGLDANDPSATQTVISDALSNIGEQATSIGAQSNGLSSQIATYEVTSINSSASRSRILDTDYAQETSEQQKNNLLLQASLIVKKSDEERKGLLINQLV